MNAPAALAACERIQAISAELDRLLEKMIADLAPKPGAVEAREPASPSNPQQELHCAD